jgi:superfamily II DNA/RNA helicase
MGSTNRQLLNYFLRDPIKIIPKYSDTLTLDLVKQYYIVDANGYTNESKLATLLDLFSTFTDLNQTCIYCKDGDTVDWLIARMDSVSHSSFRDRFNDSTKTTGTDQTNATAVSAIYPEMDLDERRAIVKSLRNCQLRALATTFIGGISGGCSHHIYDISAISQVILFDLPASAEEYLLLVGRGIPFGKPTIVISFVPAGGDENSSQSRMLKEVQMVYETTITELPSHFEMWWW